MTSDALPASRPTMSWPGGAAAWPRDMIIITIAGCESGTGTWPTANCTRKSKGTGWFGATGAPLAVEGPAPPSKKTS
jgi:hypothetical protein